MRFLKVDPSLLKWFYFGMHIKRWLVLLLVGVAIMGLGFGYFLREVYFTYTFPEWVYYATLQFLPRYVRGGLFVAGSAGIIIFAVWKLNRSLLSAFVRPGNEESLVNIIYNHRYLRRGPKVVAIGGGTGLSTLLRGLKEHTGNLTAIVTVADDGGSSGRLRRELGLPPPGDLRNCIAALADVEPLMTRLFQYRFDERSGLEGHSFGNLFIAAMSEVTGNFEEAVRETSRVLAVRGQILPSTLTNVTLSASTHDDDEMIHGESQITERGSRIKKVFINPENAQANPEAIRAILAADMIVIGPGSLYTSVLPNLLVDGIRRALEMSKAVRVYVCNVATEHGETDSFSVGDHYEALQQHVHGRLLNYVVANNNIAKNGLGEHYSEPVRVDLNGTTIDAAVVAADVISEDNRYHHDTTKLASLLMSLYYQRREVEQPRVQSPGPEPQEVAAL